MIRKLMLAMLLVVLLPIFPSADAQTTTEIGIAPTGQNAMELVGQIDQTGFTVTAYGYVTWANNLVSDLLFTEGTIPLNRTEGAARLTFMGTGTSNARSVHENIFASSVDATLTFYWNETPSGISWTDPNSFGTGVPIASFTARLQSILNVQEPNVGVLMVFTDATQDSATPFTVNAQSYQLGHVGLVQRFTLFGQGYRSSEEPLAANYRFGGNTVVVGGAP